MNLYERRLNRTRNALKKIVKIIYAVNVIVSGVDKITRLLLIHCKYYFSCKSVHTSHVNTLYFQNYSKALTLNRPCAKSTLNLTNISL